MYNKELVSKICKILPQKPKVKITRPMGSIETKVIGVVFEKGGPRLYLEDYLNINLEQCMEDIELIED